MYRRRSPRRGQRRRPPFCGERRAASDVRVSCPLRASTGGHPPPAGRPQPPRPCRRAASDAAPDWMSSGPSAVVVEPGACSWATALARGVGHRARSRRSQSRRRDRKPDDVELSKAIVRACEATLMDGHSAISPLVRSRRHWLATDRQPAIVERVRACVKRGRSAPVPSGDPIAAERCEERPEIDRDRQRESQLARHRDHRRTCRRGRVSCAAAR